MKKISIFLIIMGIAFTMSAASLTGDQILKKTDDVLFLKTSKSDVTMKVYSASGSYRTIKMVSYSRGYDLSYNLYTYPRDLNGMKYLSRFDNIWVYYPLTNSVRKMPEHLKNRPISGVGGDFSANDLSSTSWSKKYRAELKSETNELYIIEATGIVKGTYKKVVLYIDKKTFIPVKDEFYNDEGRKFKTLYYREIKHFSGKPVPTFLEMVSHDRGAKTTVQLENVKVNLPISDNYFSVDNLGR